MTLPVPTFITNDIGAPMAELRQVLPADSDDSVLRMLKEMQAAGLATLRGQRRAARWFTAANAANLESVR